MKMNIRRYPPTPLLRPYVKTYMVVLSEHGSVNRLLPLSALVIAFRIRGTVRSGMDNGAIMPVSVISGLTNSMRVIEYSRNASTFLVEFKEGGAAAFFNESLHELHGRHIPLDGIVQRSLLNEIEERLMGAAGDAERIRVVENFLLSRLNAAHPEHVMRHAVERINSARGIIRIAPLAATLCMSQDAFEKKFRRVIGTSPKQFATTVRLRSAIDNYSPGQSLTDMAYEAGYYDQSHFIKDFRRFTGLPPREFFRSAAWW